ncbi:sedoheptulokinase [Paenibacillus oryzisoli]|uniref:Carbohydrate kinase FGGY N-terminal domain-containing protein n=1 Tax=Paenibacillus oryzisoli TaxID=1850517 RepID=A0A198A5M7_9BACL|nr:FGGY family carbohydrate kinase [Paenibacillus oryzisoli]OAS16425.1 hypothetical protein A8708_20675 [Paenibacillus oryzisoli]
MRYIAIDVGSTFLKAGQLDVQNLAITHMESIRMPEPLPNENPLRKEWNAIQLLELMKGLIDRQLASCPGCKGIWITTQMHGFIITDEYGVADTPYISWQDERGLEYADKLGTSYFSALMDRVGEKAWRRTGLWEKPGVAAVGLFHMLQQADLGLEIKRERQGKACAASMNDIQTLDSKRLCTLGGYLIQSLTGSHVCHITNAAPTGLVDVRAGKWDKDIVSAVGCQALQFPRIVVGIDSVGHYHSRWGGVPVYPDIGDHQASVLGSLADAKNEAIVNMGTAGWISRVSDAYRIGEWELRPYFEGRYLPTITKLPGGRNMAVLVRFIADVGQSIYGITLTEDTLWERLLAEADSFSQKFLAGERQAGKGQLHVHVGFYGGQTGTDSGAIDCINGDNLQVGGLFAAAMEEIAAIYERNLYVLATAGEAIRRITFSGGVMMKNAFLRDAIAKAVGIEAVMAPERDEVFLGLLRLALVSEGLYASVEETREVLLQKLHANNKGA